jgi:hypothetical protein
MQSERTCSVESAKVLNTQMSLLSTLLMPGLSAAQAYMCTIANHPALQGSQELRVFLTYPTCLSKLGTGLLAPDNGSGNSSCGSSTTETAVVRNSAVWGS